MAEEYIMTKKQAKQLFNKFADDLDDKDIVYLSKILNGNTKASKDGKHYMEMGFGINPNLFKDKHKNVNALMNSVIFLIVVPDKESINPDIRGEK